jgi:hypothetical protein
MLGNGMRPQTVALAFGLSHIALRHCLELLADVERQRQGVGSHNQIAKAERELRAVRTGSPDAFVKAGLAIVDRKARARARKVRLAPGDPVAALLR